MCYTRCCLDNYCCSFTLQSSDVWNLRQRLFVFVERKFNILDLVFDFYVFFLTATFKEAWIILKQEAKAAFRRSFIVFLRLPNDRENGGIMLFKVNAQVKATSFWKTSSILQDCRNSTCAWMSFESVADCS